MQLRIEHLGLAAADPVALAEWYCSVLGGEPVFKCENPGKPATVFVRLDGPLILEIYAATQHRAETSLNALRGWRHLALRVSSIEMAQNALAARGVTFLEESKPAGGGGRVLFFHDPEGNLLHLVERTAEMPF
jgi:glyoxylase I family protein